MPLRDSSKASRSGSDAPRFESNAAAARPVCLSVFRPRGLHWFTSPYQHRGHRFRPPRPPFPRLGGLFVGLLPGPPRQEHDGRTSARRHTTPQAGDAVPVRHRAPGTDIFMLPCDLQEDEDKDHDPGTPDPNDDADLDHGGGAPARADPLDPLANFLKEMI